MSSDHVLTILLVEDDDGIRTIASVLLESEGHHVHAMANGELAIEWLKQQQPDVLFTDINMPGGMSGTELTRLARLANPGLRILMTSGDAKPDPAWLASGGHYLNKPYDRRSLLAAIEATAKAVA
jgi:CheY-like chemotaxis protein